MGRDSKKMLQKASNDEQMTPSLEPRFIYNLTDT